MTEPAPLPIPLGYPDNNIIFCCRCQVHYALTHQPLCPVCISIAAEEAKA